MINRTMSSSSARAPPDACWPCDCREGAISYRVERRRYRLIDDYNGDFRYGDSAVPMSCLPDRRMSACMAYLTQTVRRRPNLSILCDAMVERLDVHAGRARGVVLRTAAGARQIPARETILACGALQSPTVLMRSGIGSGRHLSSLGIAAVRDLTRGGSHLQTHS